MTNSDVTLLYEGTDITNQVIIAECVHRDVSRWECDCLNIRLENAETWFRWGPKKNDRIRVRRNGYDSGELYLNTIVPDDGAFRILATAMKSEAKQCRYQTYKGMTLAQIMQVNAAECGMRAKQYGISGAIQYPYLLRENESAPSFLARIAEHEGALLKVWGGCFTAISIESAQALSAAHEVALDMSQPGLRYIERRDMKWSGVKIISPYCTGSATDSAANGEERVFTDLPVFDDAQAKRWANGLLLTHNRLAETLVIESAFNPGYTAAARISITGNDNVAGDWIIDEVEHDFINATSRAKLFRCITTIF